MPVSCLPSTWKSLLRRCAPRKPTAVAPPRPLPTSRFRRMKGSNLVQEVNPTGKSHPTCRATTDYDMTILHDDELNSSHLATLRRRKKKIPVWAKKDQLQLAIINQVYFQDQTPEEIFGGVCIDQALEMIKSINVVHRMPTVMVASRHCL